MDGQIRLKTAEEIDKELDEIQWCEQGCAVPCGHCWSQEERMDAYDDARGG